MKLNHRFFDEEDAVSTYTYHFSFSSGCHFIITLSLIFLFNFLLFA